MAVPKKRVSHSRQGKRRSHHFIKPKQYAFCDRCGEAIRPHTVCAECGYYNVQGREVVAVEAEEE